MNRSDGISLLVHARDSQADLPRLLATTAWCDERIVVDMSSSDGTRRLAEDAGCRVIPIAVEPFNDGIRNRFLHEPRCSWTFVLDSDENLADDAASAIRRLVAEAPADVGAFALGRSNTIAGQVLRGSNAYPDQQVRLFRTDAVRYGSHHHRPPSLVDPSSRIDVVDPSNSPLIHHRNYDSIVDFLERQLRYASTDEYDGDPSAFDFDTYLVDGLVEFAARCDVEVDGSMSYALAIAMYWDRVVRGLIHWERTGYLAPLPTSMLPPPSVPSAAVVPSAPVAGSEADARRIAELEEAVASWSDQVRALRRSRTQRYTAPLRWLRDRLDAPRR